MTDTFVCENMKLLHGKVNEVFEQDEYKSANTVREVLLRSGHLKENDGLTMHSMIIRSIFVPKGTYKYVLLAAVFESKLFLIVYYGEMYRKIILNASECSIDMGESIIHLLSEPLNLNVVTHSDKIISTTLWIRSDSLLGKEIQFEWESTSAPIKEIEEEESKNDKPKKKKRVRKE